MTARFGLNLDVVGDSAFHETRHIFGGFWPGHSDRLDFDVQVVPVHPGSLVEWCVRKSDTAIAAITDGVEAVGQRSAWCLAHDVQKRHSGDLVDL